MPLVLMACGPSPDSDIQPSPDSSATSTEPASRPNVLILSIESLRWDHLGAAGYPRPVSPNIDRLVERGTYFENGYSQCSWTRPSVASTFTGAYVSTHLVYGEQPSESGTPLVKRDESELSMISEKFDTLAERFTSAGYYSVGWSSNMQLWEGLGFGQGFAQYSAKTNDQRIVHNLIDLFARQQKRPFFAFVHFVQTHQPYKPRPRFRQWDEHPDAVAITLQNYRDIQSGKLVLTQQDIDHNIALYDGTIRQVDTHIGQVLDALRDKGLEGNTIVVVLSDHGQEFYEHGSVTHGHTLYDELVRVPIVFAGPGVPRGKRIDAPAQNIDVLPTLVSLALGTKTQDVQGSDLTPLLNGATAENRLILAEINGRHALLFGRWKYIANSDLQEHELYDLEADSLELHDLGQDPEHQSTLTHMAGLMADALRTNGELSSAYPTALTETLPDEVLEGLEDLGYVGDE